MIQLSIKFNRSLTNSARKCQYSTRFEEKFQKKNVYNKYLYLFWWPENESGDG